MQAIILAGSGKRKLKQEMKSVMALDILFPGKRQNVDLWRENKGSEFSLIAHALHKNIWFGFSGSF